MKKVRRITGRAARATVRKMLGGFPVLFALMALSVVILSTTWTRAHCRSDTTHIAHSGLAFDRMRQWVGHQSSSLERAVAAELKLGYNKQTFVYLGEERAIATRGTGAWQPCVIARVGETVRNNEKSKKAALARKECEALHCDC